MLHEKHPLRIYVDRLKGGDVEEISEVIEPKYLEIQESDELAVDEPVTIDGQAYATNEYLVVDLNIKASITIPCAFCNHDFVLPINLKHSIHEELMSDIKHGIFDVIPLIREAIFLEVPLYPQCGGATCLRRKEIEKFLKTEKADEGHYPFVDI